MASLMCLTVEEEQQKNPELRKEDLEAIKEWCSKQAHLPKISESEIVIFLHSNYYLLEPTKTTIENYYTSRTHLPEFFANRDPIGSKEIREAMRIGVYVPLKGLTEEGFRVIYAKLVDLEPSNFVYNDVMKLYNMILDLWMFSEGTLKGHIILIDMSGIRISHAGRLSPMGIKKYLYYLQEALPVRLKGLHFMNSVPVMDIILSMMKPFMKKELMDMLYIHTTKETLAPFVPLEILPNETGGIAGSFEELRSTEFKKLESHRAWFLQEETTRRVNESLRLGKGKSATDIFGTEGSFKKLDID